MSGSVNEVSSSNNPFDLYDPSTGQTLGQKMEGDQSIASIAGEALGAFLQNPTGSAPTGDK